MLQRMVWCAAEQPNESAPATKEQQCTVVVTSPKSEERSDARRPMAKLQQAKPPVPPSSRVCGTYILKRRRGGWLFVHNRGSTEAAEVSPPHRIRRCSIHVFFSVRAVYCTTAPSARFNTCRAHGRALDALTADGGALRVRAGCSQRRRRRRENEIISSSNQSSPINRQRTLPPGNTAPNPARQHAVMPGPVGISHSCPLYC